jgi:hypothetical protein
MFDNCTYNKAKIVHELSSLCWFIQNHGITDAQKANDETWEKQLLALHKDLEKHLKEMDDCICSCK